MNTWRKVHVSLDGVTSASSESDQEAALERISALLAPYPAGKPNKLQRPFGALAGWCAPITRASNGRPVFSLGKLPRRLNALGMELVRDGVEVGFHNPERKRQLHGGED